MSSPSITIVYTTGRIEPRVEWFYDSLEREQARRIAAGRHRLHIPTFVVDFHKDRRSLAIPSGPNWHVSPKPTIWQGPHRVTQTDWWAMSNARNTGICLAQTEWICFLDDRCVLVHGWLDYLIEAALAPSPYVLLGSYTKLTGMKVESGEVIAPGTVIGEDSRRRGVTGRAKAPGGWLFGCCFAMPLEWALEVNGLEEGCDGLSFEDVIFGQMLERAKKPLYYDPRFAILEDRTPEETISSHDVGGTFRRTDKGVSPKDKSHAMLTRFGTRTRTEFTPDLREIRRVLAEGGGFPIPDPTYEYRDWYDGQLVRDMI